MANIGRWITLLLLLLAAGVGVLFTIQNSGRVTDLSIDLWLTAFHLHHPLPIPHIIWTAFAAGLIIAGAWGSLQRIGLQRRVRDLEQEVARASLRTQDDDWA